MTKVNLGKDLYLKGRIGWKGLSKSEYLEKGDFRIINAKALEDKLINWNKSGYISKERYEESPEIMLQEKDILISKDGTLGKIGYVRNLSKPSTVASGIFVLRNTSEKNLDTDYLYHFLKSNIFKHFIYRMKSSGSTINHLYQRDLSQLEINLPSLFQQQGISKTLNSIDAKIELNNKINAELEAMAKLIYDYWFVQFDFPNENGKPYQSSGGKMVFNEELKREIPAGWKVKKVNDLIDVRDGTHDSPKPVKKGHKLITSKHLKPEGLDFKNANTISSEDYLHINKRSKVDTGDILFSMIGNIGTIYKVEEKNINFAIKNVALYKTSSKQNLKNYIYMYLHGYDMQRYMGNVTAGSIQKFIGLGSLRKMPLLIHEYTISNYNNRTNSLFERMNVLKLQNQTLSSLRDWLLPMLMNGQVTIRK